MNRRKFLKKLAASGMVAAAFRLSPMGSGYVLAKDGPYPYLLKRRVTHDDRKAAATQRKALKKKLTGKATTFNANAALPNGPDYFSDIPNFANSPFANFDVATNSYKGGIRKFVDSLPGLTSAGKNNLGNYIPVAVPNTTQYPGSDYYEIGLVEYTQKFHSDLKLTKLRGYVQLNGGDSTPHYLGPVIVAQRDRPVRIKFVNKLPTGAGGDLFLPVDTTVMGAGMGPDGKTMYKQNRATVHLHGGNTPWISDGTAHQWTTPAGENTPWPKGVSVQNVPDMPAAGSGELTFYYTNQQSARLMFYHDHAYGVTRLNVYAGEAAGYVLTDAAERQLVDTGVIPADSARIPLIIQDKTFIDPDAIATQDPTWPVPLDATRNDLWYPHVYMPNQNPYDMMGANAMGRWDYGPWFWPPFTGVTTGEQPNPYYDPANAPWEPPNKPGTPDISIVPEAFMDTPIVNGQAYPYLEVDPKAYRFLILNACNDRYLNLQLYKAMDTGDVWNGTTLVNGGNAGEVKMVPAIPGTWPAGWPKPDGRDGGFPDPAAAGPNMIQIGTEGGLLPAPVTIPNRPVGYDYNRRSVTVLNVLETALFMGPAERADVIVDFSGYAGQTLILYNDAPAPVPGFDPRNDYYTNAPTQVDTGGAPPTLAGFGPNTRTIMQIRVKANTPAPAFDLPALRTALPAAFAASQDQVILPDSNTMGGRPNYSAVYPNAALPADPYVRIQDTSVSVFDFAKGSSLSAILVTRAGSGFTSAPAVAITGGGGAGAAAAAVLKPTTIASLTLNSGGVGYTSAPTVTLVGGGGTGATATCKLSAASVTGVNITNGGRGYRAAPTVIFGGGGGTGATATAVVRNGVVTQINVNNGGSGYTAAPSVTLNGGNPNVRATATAQLGGGAIASITLTNPGTGYTGVPVIGFSGGGGFGAAATASLTPTSVGAVYVTNGGTGYTSTPTVTLSGGGGTGALAKPTGVVLGLKPKAIQELFDPDYGRMNSILGCEVPNTTGNNQTTIPYYFIDPPNEILTNSDLTQPLGSAADGTQIWKITHNGVDTHAIHFHLFNVQLVNRVGWDGMVKPPDANELGWKDTVRMNPLEDCIVALRPYKQTLPTTGAWAKGLPNSIRPLDVTMPVRSTMTMGFTGVDPTGHPAPVANHLVNFGWEYTWHCHLLGHEENDMMRPIIFALAPNAPGGLSATTAVINRTRASVTLKWTNNANNATGFTVQRATSAAGPWTTVGTVSGTFAATYTPPATTYTDTTAARGTQYYYQVIANNVVGDTTRYAAPAVGYPNMSVDSTPSAYVGIRSA